MMSIISLMNPKRRISLIGKNIRVSYFQLSIVRFLLPFYCDINSREKMHLKPLCALVKEDLWSCTRLYDEILFDHPKDMFALSMLYLSSLMTGQRDLMRNVPARVALEYDKSDRFYG